MVVGFQIVCGFGRVQGTRRNFSRGSTHILKINKERKHEKPLSKKSEHLAGKTAGSGLTLDQSGAGLGPSEVGGFLFKLIGGGSNRPWMLPILLDGNMQLVGPWFRQLSSKWLHQAFQETI